MYKYLKLIYICFSMIILSFSLVMSIHINKDISIQKQIIAKNETELSYIIKLNDKIELTNYNLQELRLKNEDVNNLNNEKKLLTEKQNQLQKTINDLNNNNYELQEKINYYN